MRIAAAWMMFASWAIALGHALPSAAGETPAAEAVFYVSPGGNDQWSGKLPEPNADRTDGPFASIDRAHQAVRELRRAGGAPVPITVRIGGVHRLKGPIVITPEESGTAECPTTYTAYPGEKPVFSGGRVIASWQKDDGPLWRAELPQVKAGEWYFRQLFVDGRRATRARAPNDGYFRVTGLVDEPPGVAWNVGVDKFRFQKGDIRPWEDLGNVEVVVFHSWNTSRVRIASVDEKEGVVTFTGPTIFRPLAWDPDQRYYVENARELLDEPGEWYLDGPSGTLLYWPLPGEDLTRAEVVAPVLSELVRFEGSADEGRFVDHVHLTGLSLEHADWTLGPKGYGDPQAAVTIPAAVMADGARHCRLQRCEVARVGGYGIWFRRGCKDNRIVENHVHDLGAGGVRIGEPKMAATDVAESSRNLISSNYLHDGGHVYPAGVGFWLAQSSDNTISHNEIHSFNYSGMSIGWNWNDAPTRTLRNTIEYNHVHHVVRGILSDAGGIYTLGTQTGTVIRNNVFHDVWPYMGRPAMAWGIYFDAGSNGLVAENNVVYHTLTGGIMNTGTPGKVIRNNIFAQSAQHAAWRYTWQKEPSSVCERNIFYLTQGELFHDDAGKSDFRSKWDHNLYWRTDGEPLLFYGDEFDAWQAKGMDRHGLVADPRFVDAARFDFRLQADSPALELGFRPIDTSTVGLQGPPDWVALPQQATFPPTELPPPPPPPEPVPVEDTFEETPAGEAPRLATVYLDGSGDALEVTDEMAAAGNRCLKFVDAPNLQHVFNPHMFYTPHFREGWATLRFDLRREEGAVVAHEWRDGSQPYRVGPSIRIEPDGRLLAGGKHLLDVPAGTWFQVEIVCRLGKQADGTYDLKVTLPGEQPREFKGLACAGEQFKGLEWLGFVSLAAAKTVFYLDNVALSGSEESDH
ncbi:MAG TPA: right-handed parallel beta-helix repeat-containing protein [Thermoguttaceae bacterium]|nr:right-handed parallel beta-helix repeat-containing protein [Thermoguttaceae bacterium]